MAIRPDGTPLYPMGERELSENERLDRIVSGAPYAWRLDMEKALAAVGTPCSGPKAARIQMVRA